MKYAKAGDVMDIILIEVQLGNIDVELNKWVITFPKDDPIVHIKLMRDREQQLICVDFCRLGSEKYRCEYFLKWQKILR